VTASKASFESFLPHPLRPSDRTYLRRLRRHQRHLAQYALSKGWSADAAKWLSEELEFHDALERMAVAELRSPTEVMETILRFPAKRRRRKP
jgi:hypothetical protein